MIKYLWRGNKLLFVLQILLTLAVSATLLYMPIAVGDIVDTLTNAQQEVRIAPLMLRFFAMLAIVGAALFFRGLGRNYYKARRKKRLEMDLAKKLITKLRSPSDVINIYNQEIEMVHSSYLEMFFMLLQTMSSFALALAIGIDISWEIIVWIAATSVVMLLMNQLFAKKLALRAQKAQESNAEMSKIVSGIFAAIRTINIFHARTLALTKLDRVLENKKIANIRKDTIDFYVMMLNNLLGWLMQYGLIIGSYILVYYGRASIGQVSTMLLLMQYLTAPVFESMGYKNSIDSTKEIRNRLKAILDEPNEDVIAELPPAQIALRDVSFAYADGQAFMSGVNMRFEHGKRYLIVGQSGSGKSTILKLILKELTPKTGAILYDEKDIVNYNAPTWYRNIAYAGQKVEVLPGTLRENIILNKEYDEKKFRRVIERLNLQYLSDKFDMPLSEDLSNFSGGELQRVAIARMLYDDCPIFIFDEFSSALDNINAYQIEKELLGIDNKLIISVTHRIQTQLLDHYEKIVIMENGSIKKTGSPAELAEELQPFLLGDGEGCVSVA